MGGLFIVATDFNYTNYRFIKTILWYIFTIYWFYRS